ncbi:YggT family protein [Collinsella sp. zg1085]|nr:YggT family protein [Collinsella sp. zg1085]
MLVVVYCIMSWIPVSNQLVGDLRGALHTIVHPYLGIFQRFMPPLSGVDFSPVIAILALNFLKRTILNIMVSML